jgi:streptogramin lyase
MATGSGLLLAGTLCVLVACGSGDKEGAPGSSEATSRGSAGTSVATSVAAPPSSGHAGVTPDDRVPAGTWDGTVSDPSTAFEARLMLGACVAGEVCGEIEYLDPMQPEFVLCAPELLYKGTEGEQFVFEEQPAYRAEECLPTTLKLRYVDGDTIALDQYGEPDVVCCTGEFDVVSDEAPPPTTLPTGVSLGGLEGPLTITDLHGPTTQYAAASEDAVWFPVPGAVHRIDPSTGRIVATVAAGDARSDVGDPHGVAASGDTVWVGVLSNRSVVRIDPASNAIAQILDLDVAPYALALDGTDLWVTSFDDDAVVRVDTTTGRQTARLDVHKPTGIAVGAGSVWVVQHRDDSLVRIDPAVNTAVSTIALGSTGDDPGCGMCVENAVFAFDAVWTANNAGRSVTRIDPATGSTVQIALEHRVWAVASDGESLWASQFEPLDGNRFDVDVAGLARIDPVTHEVEQLALRSALGVTTSHGSVWAIVLGRRSDQLYRYSAS